LCKIEIKRKAEQIKEEQALKELAAGKNDKKGQSTVPDMESMKTITRKKDKDPDKDSDKKQLKKSKTKGK